MAPDITLLAVGRAALGSDAQGREYLGGAIADDQFCLTSSSKNVDIPMISTEDFLASEAF